MIKEEPNKTMDVSEKEMVVVEGSDGSKELFAGKVNLQLLKNVKYKWYTVKKITYGK